MKLVVRGLILCTLCAASFFSSAQSVETPERKLYYLQFNLDKVDDLNLETQQDHWPEVLDERAQLAPNYPVGQEIQLSDNSFNPVFMTWLNSHPEEWFDYYNYLKTFIRTH